MDYTLASRRNNPAKPVVLALLTSRTVQQYTCVLLCPYVCDGLLRPLSLLSLSFPFHLSPKTQMERN